MQRYKCHHAARVSYISLLPCTLDTPTHTCAPQPYRTQPNPTPRSAPAYLVEHVALAARESSPVGKDNQRQSFVVDVLDRLGRLVGAVRIPYATGLAGVGLFDSGN